MIDLDPFPFPPPVPRLLSSGQNPNPNPKVSTGVHGSQGRNNGSFSGKISILLYHITSIITISHIYLPVTVAVLGKTRCKQDEEVVPAFVHLKR